MKILLISANPLLSPYPVYPLGLDYLASALEPRHQVVVLDLNAAGRSALGRAAAEIQPDLVGISLRNVDTTDRTDPQGFMATYRRLMADLRRATPAPIVLGGSGFSIFPGPILADLGADFGIVGEGERLVWLVEALEKGRDPSDLPGVVSPGGLVPGTPLDRIGPRRPAAAAPHLPYYLDRGGMLNLQTQRGCPFGCVYCTYPLIEGRRLRQVDPRAAAREALDLQAAGARFLFITDSSFNADAPHSLAVAEALGRAGIKIPWGAFFTPGPAPDGYFDRLAAAGCTHVEFGTDALCDPVLAAYGKPFDAAQVLAAHRAAVAAGLNVAHYLLLGGPGETPATLVETLSRVDNLRDSVLFLFSGMRIYPDTKLWRRAVAEGHLDSREDLLTPVFYRNPAIGADEIQARIQGAAAGRPNWILGAGGPETPAVLARMHRHGFSGPLWEYLIPARAPAGARRRQQ